MACIALVLAATGGACGDDSGGATSGTTDPTDAPATAPVGPDHGRTPAPPVTTSPPGALDPPALRGDGLGVVAFGDAADDAVGALTAVLGDPDDDSGWQPSFSVYGTCPGEEVRAVTWGALVTLFTDGLTEWGEGDHLFSWRVAGAPPAIATEAGLGVGATVDDARDLHGGAVTLVPAEPPFPAFVEVEAGGGTITAYLDDGGQVITNLEGGAPCGE